MAHGVPPPQSLVEVPQGLWITPRWLGIETAPAVILVAIEFLGLIMHTTATLTVSTVVVLALYWLLVRAFERDDRMVALLLRNRHHLSIVRMRGEALVSSRTEHLERIL